MNGEGAMGAETRETVYRDTEGIPSVPDLADAVACVRAAGGAARRGGGHGLAEVLKLAWRIAAAIESRRGSGAADEACRETLDRQGAERLVASYCAWEGPTYEDTAVELLTQLPEDAVGARDGQLARAQQDLLDLLLYGEPVTLTEANGESSREAVDLMLGQIREIVENDCAAGSPRESAIPRAFAAVTSDPWFSPLEASVAEAARQVGETSGIDPQPPVGRSMGAGT